MLFQQTVPELRLKNITTCLTGAADTLKILSDSIDSPFLVAISNTTRSLLTMVETVRQNKKDCAQLLEQTYTLLYAIIALHIKSETGGDLSPSMLNHLGRFTETLHKIHAFIETQQDRSRIKQFFRKGETRILLTDCHAGLEQALNVFRVRDGDLLEDITDLEEYGKERHQEVLELIDSLSDTTSSDRGSLINMAFYSSRNSSNTISMLPSEPQIFHGRETELKDILKLLREKAPRIAILGAGGMGKTSLARAALHHPETTGRYDQHRYFVACDTATTKGELVSLIGNHLGMKPGKDLTGPVIEYFLTQPDCLLILDNLETLWEPTKTRGSIEEFLSVLTDISHLAVVITMRGAERPAKVRWTRPFLPPLNPLPHDAAHQIFTDIADDGHDSADVHKLLLLTDNIPLVINLIAHLVDLEGCSTVLSRWEGKRTSLISEGYDKRSNLDLSISLSLSSPRITSSPHSQLLLSLLSLLPDGLSNVELLQSKLPIHDILACKAALIRTSLAYIDDHQRLKVLVPIREHMQQFYPPATNLVQPLLNYFQELLEIRNGPLGTLSTSVTLARIKSNLSNIQTMLAQALNVHNPDIVKAIYCAIHLNDLSEAIGYGSIPVMDTIPSVLPQPRNHKLEVFYITRLLDSATHPVSDLEALIDQALEHMSHLDDPDLKCMFSHLHVVDTSDINTLGKFYLCLGEYQRLHNTNIPAAMNCQQTALFLATSSGNTKTKVTALRSLAWIKWQIGDYRAGQMQAHEAQRLAKIDADLYREASALHTEATCWSPLGNYKDAISLCQQARHLLNLCGLANGHLDHAVMNTQAGIYNAKSEYEEARHIQTQILHKVAMEQDWNHHALASLCVAQIALETGASRNDVQSQIDTARARFSSMGFLRLVEWCDMSLADLDLQEGNLLTARPIFQKGLKASLGKWTDVVTFCLERLGNGSRWGSTDSTSNWTIIFLVHALKSKEILEIHEALQFLGDVFQTEGDLDTAVSLFTAALQGFTEMEVHRGRAECMLRLGDILSRQGNVLKAVELWKTAQPLFERSSQRKQLAQLNARLVTVPRDIFQNAPTETLSELEIGSTDATLTKNEESE